MDSRREKTSMYSGRRTVKKLVLLILVSVASPLISQVPTCKRFLAQNTQLPNYPPIARAAHMSGTIRFTVIIPLTGAPNLVFLDGPHEGVWQTLVTSAHDYLASRKYGWFEAQESKPCSYIASVEFRQSGEALPPPNNYLRVTVIDETHTVVEVKPTVSTVSY